MRSSAWGCTGAQAAVSTEARASPAPRSLAAFRIIASPSLVIHQLGVPHSDPLPVDESGDLHPAVVDVGPAQRDILEVELRSAADEQGMLRRDVGIGRGNVGLQGAAADNRRRASL